MASSGYNSDATIICEGDESPVIIAHKRFTKRRYAAASTGAITNPRQSVAFSTGATARRSNGKLSATQRRTSIKFAKGPDYFAIQKILAHRATDTGFEYELQWVGYGPEDNTWEPEAHLNGAEQLLTSYKRVHGLGEPTVQFKVGSNNSALMRKELWVDRKEILSAISIERKVNRYSPFLKVEIFTHLKNEDYIFILLCDFHAFVGLHLKDKKTIYIADNGNMFINNLEVRNTVEGYLEDHANIAIKPLIVNQTFGSDQCASAAVCIVIELLRLYSSHDWRQDPEEIWSPVKIRDRVVKRFGQCRNRPASKPVDGVPRRPYFRCPCGKSFISTNRNCLRMHKISCKKAGENEGSKDTDVNPSVG